MGKVRYLDHESHERKCDEKLVTVIMGKVIQTCVGINREFTSRLLDWRLREPILSHYMGDNRFVNLFSKICNFLINDL